MVSGEQDADVFGSKLDNATVRMTSPLAIWETAINVSRILQIDHDSAVKYGELFIDQFGIEVVAVLPEMTDLALDAFRRYGKGRHAAALNFGDCFAYACAKHHKVPLLYKGNDFALTDIESA